MCIIVVKPKGEEFPTWKTLETCFDNNGDGAGFMWNDGKGGVSIRKGFMEFSSFKKAIKELKRNMTKDTAVVMHFRIKTHGEVSRECCHPFPLENSLERLRLTECSCRWGVAHNGIITGRMTNARCSDTMDYVMKVLYPLMKVGGSDWLQSKWVQNLIVDTCDSTKFAILNGNGNVKLIGNFQSKDGCFFSNSTYETSRYTYGSFTNGAAPKQQSTSIVHSPKYYDWEYYSYGDQEEDYLEWYDLMSPEEQRMIDGEMERGMPSLECYFDCQNYTYCNKSGYICAED